MGNWCLSTSLIQGVLRHQFHPWICVVLRHQFHPGSVRCSGINFTPWICVAFPSISNLHTWSLYRWSAMGLCGNPVFTSRPGSWSRYCAIPIMCLQPVKTGIWKTTHKKIYNLENPDANNCFPWNLYQKILFKRDCKHL